jgi:hypothetical protein
MGSVKFIPFSEQSVTAWQNIQDQLLQEYSALN